MLKVRVASTARKHKLTATRILAALAGAELQFTKGDAAYYIGTDNLGVELEMIVVPDDRNEGGFTVTHAMPIRYRE